MALSIANVFRNIHILSLFSLFLKVSDIYNISSKCWLPNKSANKIFLHKTPYTPFLFQVKICVLHRRIFQKHPLFITFLVFLTVDEVCYISDKYQPPNNLAKHQYFYTRDFISLPHFKYRFALSIADSFRNIHFLLRFYKFWQWMRCAIFQINTYLLIS